MSPPRKRADTLLVERGLFESRARAQAAIEAGLVTANDKQVMKSSESIAADAVLQAQPAHPSQLFPTWIMILPNSGKPEFGGASRNDKNLSRRPRRFPARCR